MLLLERGALVRELELVASTDAKTDVLNTSGWYREAESAIERTAKSGAYCVAVLMIDLDHFKRINDRHGHLAGDTVLRRVAQTISAQVRSTDVVGRFGGEEFVVLVPRASTEEITAIAERIRRAVDELVIEIPAGPPVTGVSVSVGVAVTATRGPVDELLHSADEAMYRAKQRGRNRVAVANAA